MGRSAVLLLAMLVVGALVLIDSGDAIATHTCDPDNPDYDGDGLPSTCDPLEWNGDTDGDGYTDSIEVFISKHPVDACSFPPDMDGNRWVNILDVAQLTPPAFGSIADDPDYRAKLDLNADEVINILDVVRLTPPVFDTHCPFPYTLYWDTVTLHRETSDSDRAFHWHTDCATIYSQYSAIYCGELERAGDHWTNNSDFDFSLSYTGWECDGTGDVAFFEVYWPPDIAAGVVMWGSDGQCSESDPCEYAVLAHLYMNANHLNNNIMEYRHMVFTHELGHVVTHGDIDRCDSPAWSIMFDDPQCLWDAGLHWPRGNDILFTNIKY